MNDFRFASIEGEPRSEDKEILVKGLYCLIIHVKDTLENQNYFLFL